MSESGDAGDTLGREGLDAHAATFSIVADETRLRILLVLAEQVERGGPTSFSEAMRAADVDDSGRFNYHLSKLLGELVEEREEGYVPTEAGREVVDSIIMGRLTGDGGVLIELDADCQGCESPLVTGDGEDAIVACSGCEPDRLPEDGPAVRR